LKLACHSSLERRGFVRCESLHKRPRVSVRDSPRRSIQMNHTLPSHINSLGSLGLLGSLGSLGPLGPLGPPARTAHSDRQFQLMVVHARARHLVRSLWGAHQGVSKRARGAGKVAQPMCGGPQKPPCQPWAGFVRF